jgi:hypothetical protein
MHVLSPSSESEFLPNGDSLSVEFVNTGTECATIGPGYHWEQELPDGTWETVPLQIAFPAVAAQVAPGGVWKESAPIDVALAGRDDRWVKDLGGGVVFTVPVHVVLNCDALPSAPAQAELRLLTPVSTLKPGDSISYRIVNTGATCLGNEVSYAWDRLLPDGTWQEIRLPCGFIVPEFIGPPGSAIDKTATLPPDAVPGTYRLRDDDNDRGITLTAGPFEVVAP